MNPTVAVIIPTYNRAHCVGEAIQSVLDQTVPADEIIVIDDGSTDNTAEVLDGFGDRITVIRQPNAGVSAARNAGIARAMSNWVTFLDSDDLWYPNRLAVLLRDIMGADAGVHIANIEYSGSGYRKQLFDIWSLRAPTDRAERYPNGLSLIYRICAPQGMGVRREWLLAAGGFDVGISFAEDFELFSRMSCYGPWLATTTIVADVRRLPSDSNHLCNLLKSDPVQAMRGQMRGFQNVLSMPDVTGADRKQILREISGCRYIIARELYFQGRLKESRRELLKSAFDHPTAKGYVRALLTLLLGGSGYRLQRWLKPPGWTREDAIKKGID